MKLLRSALPAALLLLIVPAVLRLGIWAPDAIGLDAVSAVTPGYIAVVGAGNTSGPGAPASPTIQDLVRGAFYLSGGLHRAIDPDAELVLIRPAHVALEGRALTQHVEVVQAVIQLLRDIAADAEIVLLLGGVPGSGVTVPTNLAADLQNWIDADPANEGQLQVLRLDQEEMEEIEVPDGGEAADLYPVPIALLECDAVVNIARYNGALSALRNLEGLAPRIAGDTEPAGAEGGDDASGYLVDMALLAEVEYTVLDLLGRNHPGSPVVLASADGIAVDRLAAALAGHTSTPPLLLRAGDRQLGMAELSGIKVGGLDVPGTWTPEAKEAAGTD